MRPGSKSKKAETYLLLFMINNSKNFWKDLYTYYNKPNIYFDLLRFIKNCDALNFECFVKKSFFEYFGYSDK